MVGKAHAVTSRREQAMLAHAEHVREIERAVQGLTVNRDGADIVLPPGNWRWHRHVSLGAHPIATSA